MQDCRRSVGGVAMSGAGGSAAGAGSSAGDKRRAEVLDLTCSDDDDEQQQVVGSVIQFREGIIDRRHPAYWLRNSQYNHLALNGYDGATNTESLNDLRKSTYQEDRSVQSVCAPQWDEFNAQMRAATGRAVCNFRPHHASPLHGLFQCLDIEITPEIRQAMDLLLTHVQTQADKNLQRLQQAFAEQVHQHVVACLVNNEQPYCRFFMAASRPPFLPYGFGVLVELNNSDDYKQTEHGNMKPWSVMIQTCRKHNGELLTSYLNHDVDEINVVTRMTAEWFKMAEYRMQHGDYPPPYEGL